MSDRELLEDIHKMLTKVCSYVDKVEDEDYKQEDRNIQFLLNVAADMYIELLEKLRRNETN